ncbi:SDR family NAD(P)-dependent oxidoreductase [Billgrantia endophytica]|uniref:SDR family NAD(P)-dependent oxidoreductase n=1 Tax=Billgrantia endophytica TaxID=2033802 RepID=UPI0013FDAE3A|nr:SDR family oxidoreductase [Halomonas endophytica]
MNADLFSVEGKVILVAGGARGLGRYLAGELAAHGAHVVLADRLVDEGEAAVAELPGSGHGFQFLDLLDHHGVHAAVAQAEASFGALDVVLNSAGIAAIAPAMEMDITDFERTLAVNVTGAFALSRAAAAAMRRREGGRIVHLASVSSCVVNPQYAAYSTSKAALSQLVRILALEWAESGITVNAIGPAMTPTPLTEVQLLADEESRRKALGKIPMGRYGRPGDLLGALLLLASPAGSFITGQTLFVDGGRTLL